MFLHEEEHNRHACLFLTGPVSPTLSLLAVGLTLTVISKAEFHELCVQFRKTLISNR